MASKQVLSRKKTTAIPPIWSIFTSTLESDLHISYGYHNYLRLGKKPKESLLDPYQQEHILYLKAKKNEEKPD